MDRDRGIILNKLEHKRPLTENQERHDAEKNIDPDSREIVCQEEREGNRGLLVQSNKSSRHNRCHGTDPLEVPTSKNPKVDSTTAKATNLEMDVLLSRPLKVPTFWRRPRKRFGQAKQMMDMKYHAVAIQQQQKRGLRQFNKEKICQAPLPLHGYRRRTWK